LSDDAFGQDITHARKSLVQMHVDSGLHLFACDFQDPNVASEVVPRFEILREAVTRLKWQ
jgi:hypothetical protein